MLAESMERMAASFWMRSLAKGRIYGEAGRRGDLCVHEEDDAEEGLHQVVVGLLERHCHVQQVVGQRDDQRLQTLHGDDRARHGVGSCVLTRRLSYAAGTSGGCAPRG